MAAAAAIAAAIAWIFGGRVLGDFLTGLQRSALPWWPFLLPFALLSAALAARTRTWRRPGCPACDLVHPGVLFEARVNATSAPRSGRRAFLRRAGIASAAGTATAVAAGLRNRGWAPVFTDVVLAPAETLAPRPRPEWTGARIRNHRRLGRTGAMVSDISLGSGRITDVEVARRALDRGVNYFDTSPDYSAFGSEAVLGEAMKGRRHDVFVATKFCTGDGHLPNDTPVPRILEAVEGSLRRLGTDHVDLVHIHSCADVERLMAPNIHEAFDRLKEQGKARFLGVSSHAPGLETVAEAAIDSGRFDVMMLAYHFARWPKLEAILARAAAADIGVVAMKTLKGARHADLAGFEREAGSYTQSAFRWVLANPHVSCLVVSFSKLEHCDEYLYASGSTLDARDIATLERYDDLVRGDYCQPHCGLCLSSCPVGLPIHDVLRYRMYLRDYGWPAEGLSRYAALPVNASACADCAAPCAGTCPIDVPIREKMLDAHRLLHSAA